MMWVNTEEVCRELLPHETHFTKQGVGGICAAGLMLDDCDLVNDSAGTPLYEKLHFVCDGYSIGNSPPKRHILSSKESCCQNDLLLLRFACGRSNTAAATDRGPRCLVTLGHLYAGLSSPF
jgi:hypothetical protein